MQQLGGLAEPLVTRILFSYTSLYFCKACAWNFVQPQGALQSIPHILLRQLGPPGTMRVAMKP